MRIENQNERTVDEQIKTKKKHQTLHTGIEIDENEIIRYRYYSSFYFFKLYFKIVHPFNYSSIDFQSFVLVVTVDFLKHHYFLHL